MRYKGFNINIEEINQVDDIMRNEFFTLNNIKNIIKQHKRNSKEHELLRKQIQSIKSSLKNKVFKVFKVKVSQKDYNYYQCYMDYPTKNDIKDTLNEFFTKLRTKRKRNIIMNEVEKNILGYEYKTIGGTFNKLNSIIDIQNKTNQMTRIMTPKVPAKEFKTNYVGIELELFCKLDRHNLLENFIKEKLAGYVCVKDDGSLRPENNYHPHEVTVLCKQDMAEEIIPKIIKVLRSQDCDAAVNNSCGMHLHIDVRNRDPYTTYSKLVKALPLLTKLVPNDRISNTFCRLNTLPDLKSQYKNGLIENGPITSTREIRYQAINPLSVAKYKTIEIRLHSGTLNIKKILNWIDICTSIADSSFDDKVDSPESFYDDIKADNKLIEYMEERIKLFNKDPAVDTKADFIMDVVAGF